jgi:ABC-type ATPase involved in cell division
MSRLILSNVLATSGSLVVDGKAGFTTLIDVICDKGHSIKTLTETDLERMVGEKYCILRKQTGNVETAHALIVKNSSNDNICLDFSCFQIASTNHYAGIHCLAFSHEWMHCFNKLMGAPNGEVLPELVN